MSDYEWNSNPAPDTILADLRAVQEMDAHPHLCDCVTVLENGTPTTNCPICKGTGRKPPRPKPDQPEAP